MQQDYFEVDLTFNEIMHRLHIPFAAVRAFFDPSVDFCLQFDIGDPEEGARFDSFRNAQCPKCKIRMVHMADKDQFHIHYECCPRCFGCYLDAGEFKDLKDPGRAFHPDARDTAQEPLARPAGSLRWPHGIDASHHLLRLSLTLVLQRRRARASAQRGVR